MNKELSDRVWSVLPKEFKEEVKKYYDNPTALGAKAVLLLENFFGHHNLTSEAEGEEMLTVPRSKVQEEYAILSKELSHRETDAEDYIAWNYAKMTFEELFGSKCLPDEVAIAENATTTDPKPAGPKFKVGDEVIWDKRIIAYVDEILNDGDYIIYSRVGNRYTVHESDLEPYTEPKEPTCSDDCPSQCPSHLRNLSQETANCDKCPKSVQKTHPDFGHSVLKDEMVDSIIKDGFAKERRLNIAAMMAQAILTRIDDTPQVIAETAFRYADALIAGSTE